MNIFDRARILAGQRGITISEALAELSRRSAEVRRTRVRKNFGVLHPMRADRAAFDAVESPRYWYMDRD